MAYLLIKTIVSALLIVAVSELSRRSAALGGLLASLPIVSLLAFCWLYRDTRDAAKIAALSTSILWLVVPSLILFALLPVLLRHGLHFYPALGLSVFAMLCGYGALLAVLSRFGIRI